MRFHLLDGELQILVSLDQSQRFPGASLDRVLDVNHVVAVYPSDGTKHDALGPIGVWSRNFWNYR